MRVIGLLVIGSALALVVFPPTFARAGEPMPPGDYRNRCKDVVYAQGTLHATCQRFMSRIYEVESHLNYQECKWRGYETVGVNQEGRLYCYGVVG